MTARLTLRGPGVLRIHAVVDDGELIDLATGRTLLNGRAVERQRLATGDRISIGPYTIDVAVGSAYDTLEAQLLDAIEADDQHALDVYADWLEERGDTRRAEVARIEQRLTSLTLPFSDRRALEDRQHELACELDDESWVQRVAPYATRHLFAQRREKPRGDWDLPAELHYLYALQPRR